MSRLVFICVNFGRCPAADNPREHAMPSAAACPLCGEPMVRAAGPGLGIKTWLAIGALVLTSASIITVAMASRRDLSARQAGAAAEGFSAGQIVNGSASSRGAALTTRYFTTPLSDLMQAASKGDTAAVRQMLRAMPDLIRVKGRGGINLAHLALLQNDLTAFATLLAAGVDAHAPAENGISPLMAAAMLPDARFLRVALKGRAPLAQKDLFGRTALHLAVQQRQVENVRLLLEAGSDPNGADSRGGTPWLAAFQGRRPMPEIVLLLRQHGADNNRADQSGLKAQDYAMAFGEARIMSLIR